MSSVIFQYMHEAFSDTVQPPLGQTPFLHNLHNLQGSSTFMLT